MANGCPSENYVAARRRVPVRDRPMRPLRNISRAATYIQRFFMQHLWMLRRRFEGPAQSIHDYIIVGHHGQGFRPFAQGTKAPQLVIAENVVGNEDVIETAICHDLGLTDLLAGDSDRAGSNLRLGKVNTLVRLDMRTKLQAIVITVLLEPAYVSERHFFTNYQRWGLNLDQARNHGDSHEVARLSGSGCDSRSLPGCSDKARRP